jgi:hypothetical protein
MKINLLKTITYRIIGTLTTIFISHSMGVSLKLSSLIGLGELILKPFIYFLHEIVWGKILNLENN